MEGTMTKIGDHFLERASKEGLVTCIQIIFGKFKMSVAAMRSRSVTHLLALFCVCEVLIT
jgi:hypothetical protein